MSCQCYPLGDRGSLERRRSISLSNFSEARYLKLYPPAIYVYKYNQFKVLDLYNQFVNFSPVTINSL